MSWSARLEEPGSARSATNLGRLVALENRQADLLERICDGTLIGGDELRARGALDYSAKVRRCRGVAGQGLLLE